MDDNSDTAKAIDDVVQALKLAGVTEDVIASQLLAKGCVLQLMGGLSADEILDDLLPKNISTQVFKAFLENSASEQGSRMTAMDNATRNAGDLVKSLTIVYNRSRQAAITKELIEIISGAESL